jgi:hypothetical protein
MDSDPLTRTGHIAGEQRNLSSQKSRVLSRKAVERTHLLKIASRHMIDSSKALVSESKRRNKSAAQTLSRERAVKVRETFERQAA